MLGFRRVSRFTPAPSGSHLRQAFGSDGFAAGDSLRFSLTSLQTNPMLKKVVLRLNDADIEKVRAGVDPYVPKGKHDKSDTGFYFGRGDGETLLFASGKPSPSEMQTRGFTTAKLVF